MVSSRATLSIIVAALLSGPTPAAAQVPTQFSSTEFGQLVTQLSEPGRYFDTDNLISNEATYLDVVPGLYLHGIGGGIYLGVGPAQNFSYIAHVRPRAAFLIDLRRDNLLQHLWYKALFRMAPSRMEFLSLMYGRRPVGEPSRWPLMPVAELVDAVAGAEPVADREQLVAAVVARAASLGVQLSPEDSSTISVIHRRFIEAGPALRFETHGRAARACYPTHRDLLVATDINGQAASYLAQESSYAYLRLLQDRNLLIPVVGDLAGRHAMPALADTIASWDSEVSAFYTSNVELYLVQDGVFGAFADNLRALPRNESTAIIRSVFDRPGFGSPAPLDVARPGCSDQKLAPVNALLEGLDRGVIRSYRELAEWEALPLESP